MFRLSGVTLSCEGGEYCIAKYSEVAAYCIDNADRILVTDRSQIYVGSGSWCGWAGVGVGGEGGVSRGGGGAEGGGPRVGGGGEGGGGRGSGPESSGARMVVKWLAVAML